MTRSFKSLPVAAAAAAAEILVLIFQSSLHSNIDQADWQALNTMHLLIEMGSEKAIA